MLRAAVRLQNSALERSLQQVFDRELDSILDAVSTRPHGCSNSSKLALAVSGGVDSMAMSSLVAKWREKHPEYSLYGFVVDHGLRPEAQQEALETSQRLLQLGIQAQVLKLGMRSEPGEYFEAKARELRRERLVAACRSIGSPPILLAHTLDDQVETFLMRVVKNSGWIGLAGTRPMIQWPQRYCGHTENPVWLVRPMLKMAKLGNYEICTSRSVPWSEDSSNYDPKVTERNAVRAYLAHPAVSSTPLKKAIECTVQAYSDYLSSADIAATAACAKIDVGDVNKITIPDTLLDKLDPHVQELVVLRCAAKLTPKSPTTFAYHRTTIVRAFRQIREQAIVAATAASLKMTRTKAGIVFKRANPRRNEMHDWKYYPISTEWSQWYLLDGRFYARWKCLQAQSYGTHVKLAFSSLSKEEKALLLGKLEPKLDLQRRQALSAGRGVHLQMRWENGLLIGYPTLGVYSKIDVEIKRADRAD